jgi:hypothetical protein
MTNKREKPILFSTPMVQGIQKLLKTMTRRLNGLQEINKNPDQWALDAEEYSPNGYIVTFFNSNTKQYLNIKCPWTVGDILWVRETWLEYKGIYYYKADDPFKELDKLLSGKSFFKWRPSIFMPREATRLFLEVKNVRVERLQDITEEDARAEGVKDPYDYQNPDFYEQPHMRGIGYYKSAFAGLWDSLNKKRGYPFSLNCWVWVIEFERVER